MQQCGQKVLMTAQIREMVGSAEQTDLRGKMTGPGNELTGVGSRGHDTVKDGKVSKMSSRLLGWEQSDGGAIHRNGRCLDETGVY